MSQLFQIGAQHSMPGSFKGYKNFKKKYKNIKYIKKNIKIFIYINNKYKNIKI